MSKKITKNSKTSNAEKFEPGKVSLAVVSAGVSLLVLLGFLAWVN